MTGLSPGESGPTPGQDALRKVVVKRTIVLGLSAAFAAACLSASGAPRTQVLQMRSAEQMSCPPPQITIVKSSVNTYRDEVSWTAVCAGHNYYCRLRPAALGKRIIICDETRESRNYARVRNGYSAPLPPAKSPSSGITPQEGFSILKSAEPEMQICTKGAGAAVKLKLQVNGDGSVNYLGTVPTAPVEASACLRKLVSTIRFRSTGADPFTAEFVVEPPEAPPPLPASSESEPSVPSVPDAGPPE